MQLLGLRAMSNIIPAPPVFKASFIQMQRPQAPTEEPNTNYLTSSYIPNEEHRNTLIHQSPSISPMTHCDTSARISPKMEPKKRRRSSSKEDTERKRKNLKAQHSVIEKKRRIKMNREFEALKFIVPACRTSILGGLTNSNSFENSHLMHKLTILQSTVEYIKYLHLIIRLMKLQMLLPKDTRANYKSWFQKNTNLDFVDFDLYLERYRDIDKDFDFEEMFLQVWKNKGTMPEKWLDPITIQISRFLNDDTAKDDDLIQAARAAQQTGGIKKAEQTENAQRAQQHSYTMDKSHSTLPYQAQPLSRDKGSSNGPAPIVLPKMATMAPLTPMTLLEPTSRRTSQTPSQPTDFRLPLPALQSPQRPMSRELSLPHLRPKSQSMGVLTGLPSLVDAIPMSPVQTAHGTLPVYSSSSSLGSSSEGYTPNYHLLKEGLLGENATNGALHSRTMRVNGPTNPTAPPVTRSASPLLPRRDEEHEASQVLISLCSNQS